MGLRINGKYRAVLYSSNHLRRKFSGKEKKETPVKEKATEALQEGFDLRKFLAENRK